MGTLGSTTWVCACGGPGVLLRGDGGDLWQVRAFERMGERHEVLACRGRSGGAVGRRTWAVPPWWLLPLGEDPLLGRASHPARMARRSRKPMALPQVAGHATIAHSRISPTEGTSSGEQQPRCNLPSTPCTSGCWATTNIGRAGGAPEALCTLGNGYVATRGAAPDCGADAVHYPGTYLAGGYNRLTTTIAGRDVENEDLVNLPNWLPLTMRIDDGAWMCLDTVEIVAYRQELDLRQGVLRRTVRFRDPQGRLTRWQEQRLVSMAQPHLAGLAVEVTAELGGAPDGALCPGRQRDQSGRAALPGLGQSAP